MAKKSSNADTDLHTYIQSMMDIIASGRDLKDFSRDITKAIEEAVKNVQIKNSNQLTKKEINDLRKVLENITKVGGMSTGMSSAGLKDVVDSLNNLSNFKKVDFDNAIKAFSNAMAQMTVESEKAKVSGNKGIFFKDSDSQFAKTLVTGTAKAMGVSLTQGLTDSISKKFFAFMGDLFNQRTKQNKSLATNIVEGMAANKFIGGALTDTFKLMGLFAAKWVKGIPIVGDKLAPIIFGAFSALGPVLTPVLIAGVFGGFMKAIPKLFSGVSTLIMSILRNSGKLLFGGGLRTLFRMGAVLPRAVRAGHVGMATSILANFLSGGSKAAPVTSTATTAANTIAKISSSGKLVQTPLATGALATGGKLATKAGTKAVAKTALRSVPILGSVLGLGMDSVAAYKSFKEGDKGAGALFTGAALASALGLALAPFTGGISAVIGGGIALILSLLGDWKKGAAVHEKASLDNQGKILSQVEEIKEETLGDKFKNWLDNRRNKKEAETRIRKSGGEVKNIISPIADDLGAKSVGRLRVSADGSILNAGDFTQSQLSKELTNYAKKNPSTFSNVYELAPQGVANLASFQTDAIFSKDGRTGALLYKGASEDLIKLRKQLKEAGLSEAKIADFMFSSGLMTGSNRSHTKGGWKSHANPYALSVDLAGAHWTRDDYKKAYDVVRRFYAAKGMDAQYEVGGRFTTPEQAFGSNAHFDVKPITNFRPAGAAENLRVKAELSSIAPAKADTKEMEKEAKEKYQNTSFQKEIQEKRESQKESPKVFEKPKNNNIIGLDVSGNKTFSKLQQTLSNYVNIGTENIFC